MRKSTHSWEYRRLRQWLTAARQRAGLSQRGLASKLGVPHTWISKVESGERRIDLVELARFCAACGLSAPEEISLLLREWTPPANGRRGKGGRS
jgi:transcriptional regulator with XRE-family HTH domain